MSVLYLLTAPPPLIEGTDAVFQEVAALKAAFGGESRNLCPWRSPGRPYPPKLYGLHNIWTLRSSEKRHRINHLYHSIPFAFPVLRLLRNPTVLTVVAGVPSQAKPKRIDALNALHRLVVSNARDADALSSWGLANIAIVPPSIDTSSVEALPPPQEDGITLLMASAPWTLEQFDSKGVDLLFDIAAELPSLRLILLWRGHLLDELMQRITHRRLNDRVEVVPNRVNIADYLRRAHATVLLAKRGDIVKAYPHSLLESLVAARPVILSDALPMADYVRQRGCGLVLREVTRDSLASAIGTLKRSYAELARNAMSIAPSEFSRSAMIERYRAIYGI